jgi:hypothetical protein
MISVDDAMKIIFEQAYKMPIIDRSLTGMNSEVLSVLLNLFKEHWIFSRMFGLYICRRSRC